MISKMNEYDRLRFRVASRLEAVAANDVKTEPVPGLSMYDLAKLNEATLELVMSVHPEEANAYLRTEYVERMEKIELLVFANLQALMSVSAKEDVI